MPKFVSFTGWIGLLALVAAVALAAPILPQQPHLPDEVLCVAKIDRVSITVPPLPAEFAARGRHGGFA